MTKNVIIHKLPKSADSPYCMVGEEELSCAMRCLSGSAFKLYMYLCKNQNKTTWYLNEQGVINFTGMSKAAYYRALDELKEKKYLRKNCDGIHFYELNRDRE